MQNGSSERNENCSHLGYVFKIESTGLQEGVTVRWERGKAVMTSRFFFEGTGESKSEVARSCLILCHPMDPPGSSVHRILQARILEWIAISFSRGSSWPRDRTQVSHIAGRHINLWATRFLLIERIRLLFLFFSPHPLVITLNLRYQLNIEVALEYRSQGFKGV